MLTFTVIDVETANADRASICQIGIIHVREGNIEDQWETLVNPEDWFDPWNVSFHGIDEHMVRNSPTLPDLRGELRSRLRSSVLVSHGSFDRIAFEPRHDTVSTRTASGYVARQHQNRPSRMAGKLRTPWLWSQECRKGLQHLIQTSRRVGRCQSRRGGRASCMCSYRDRHRRMADPG